MDTNGINLDDGILDPLELDGSAQTNTGYVPKFERDLAKAGGDLNALSEAKKAETAPQSDEITGEIDLSSLRSEEEYAELVAADEEEAEFVTEDEIDDYATLDAYDESKNAVSESEIVSEPASGPKSFADFAREAEEAEKRAQAQKQLRDDKNLDGVDMSKTMLSDMNYDRRKDNSRSIRQQMEMDDIAMSMGNKPIIEDMSKEYAPTQKKAEDLALKDVLDRDERQIIKNRLEQELGKNAHRSSKKSSLQMYHDLMNQQKVRKAKQGFFVVLLLMAFGIITAVISYFKLWTGNEDLWSSIPILMYIPFATAFFALLLLVKAKFAKILSTLYFAVNTVVLIGPGFIKFCIDNSENGLSEHIFMVIYFAAAILLSAIICIQLCTNDKVEAYYSTHLITDDKKVFDENKSKYKQ
ncbi:MAG: hypothetical protein IJ007_06260 [Oscillospiraceae bacterium]|nr:hypothetical protein [Oscillospiraceae bacterium]